MNVACILARTESTRLPNKALIEIQGKKLLEYCIERIKNVKNIDEIYLCTSDRDEDRILLDIAKKNGIKGYAGSEKSIIDRMLDVGRNENASNIIRVNGDNPFTDDIFTERMIEEHLKHPSIDYTRVEYLPLGISTEIMRYTALKKCAKLIEAEKSEHQLTLAIYNPDNFPCMVLIPEDDFREEYLSFTVDYQEDLEKIKIIVEALYRNGRVFLDDILKYLKENNVPNTKIDKNMEIKVAANKKMTYFNYKEKIMKRRIKRCEKVYLEKEFYAKRKAEIN